MVNYYHFSLLQVQFKKKSQFLTLIKDVQETAVASWKWHTISTRSHKWRVIPFPKPTPPFFFFFTPYSKKNKQKTNPTVLSSSSPKRVLAAAVGRGKAEISNRQFSALWTNYSSQYPLGEVITIKRVKNINASLQSNKDIFHRTGYKIRVYVSAL